MQQATVQFRRSPRKILANRVDHPQGLPAKNAGGSPESPLPSNGEVVDKLQLVLERLQENEVRRVAMLDELRGSLTDLAMQLASQIVLYEIQNKPAFLESALEELTSTGRAESGCQIYMAPEVNEQLQHVLEGSNETVEKLEFHSDPALEWGDIRVIENGNELICSLEARLYKLKQILMEEYHGTQIERRKNHITNPGIGRFPERRASG